jgi:hypothetical protein
MHSSGGMKFVHLDYSKAAATFSKNVPQAAQCSSFVELIDVAKEEEKIL